MMSNIACSCGAFPYGGIHATNCPMSPHHWITPTERRRMLQPVVMHSEDINPDALDSHIGTGMAGAVPTTVSEDLLEPPFCARCGGSCLCDDWKEE